MPSNDKSVTEEDQNKVKASQAITVVLSGKDSIYYYTGQPNYEDFNSLKPSSYKPDGIRALLLKRNDVAVSKINELKQKKLQLKITQEQFTEEAAKIKNGKNTPVVIIKATDNATYKNLIDALDEMQICNIGKYVIDTISAGDKFLIRNLQTKGELSRNIAK